MFGFKSVLGEEGDILTDQNFQLLLLANLMGPLSNALLSPILESLIEPFDATPANIGLMISASTAPAIVIFPIAGMLADRYGRKPVLVSSLTLFGVAGVAIAFTTDYRIVLFLRFLQGVGFGGMTPIIITSIGDLYADARETTAQGLRFTSSGLASAVFPLLSGSLVLVAWQYPFFIYGLSIPVAIALLLWFEEPTDWSTPDASEGTTEGYLSPMDQVRALTALIKQRRVYALVVARGLPMFIWIGFLTYNSIIIIRFHDGTPTHAGMLVTVVSITYAAAASQAGRLTSRFDSRFYPLLGANGCLGVGFGLYLFAPVIWISGVGIAITGVGFGLSLTFYRSIITHLADETLRGGVVSLGEGFGRIVGTATPILMGAAIASLTPTVGFASAVQNTGLGVAILGSVGGVVCLFVVRTSPPVINPL